MMSKLYLSRLDSVYVFIDSLFLTIHETNLNKKKCMQNHILAWITLLHVHKKLANFDMY